MRKVVLFMHLSLDGFCATPSGELDWVPYNDELQEYAQGIVNSVGSPLYGRMIYEMMRNYWHWALVLKDPAATAHEIEHTKWLENVDKVVFSRTLQHPDWKNTRVISDNIADEVMKLKDQPGKDLVIFGSPTLARAFIDLGLIDEYQFTVSPVILGSGMTIFKDIQNKVQLKLLDSRTFKAGVVALHYEVIRE